MINEEGGAEERAQEAEEIAQESSDGELSSDIVHSYQGNDMVTLMIGKLENMNAFLEGIVTYWDKLAERGGERDGASEFDAQFDKSGEEKKYEKSEEEEMKEEEEKKEEEEEEEDEDKKEREDKEVDDGEDKEPPSDRVMAEGVNFDYYNGKNN